MMPSANQVAWAIVAACRETGEDPLVVAEQRKPQSRARHYAFQSLKVVFPDVKVPRLAFLCGCAGHPVYYASESAKGMHRHVGGKRKGERRLRFWDEGVFARVIAAVKLADADEPLAPKAPIKLSAKVASIVEPKRPAALPGKRKLEDIMREAVINTQRMTPPPEE
jgi:hypothetical protein